MPPRSVAGLLQDVLDAAEFMQARARSLHADAIDLRHVLVHGYAAIDHAILWNAFERFLPELVADVHAAMDGR